MSSDSRVILKRLNHIWYSHSDIDWTRNFLRDFGMQQVAQLGDRYYFKGYGDLPYIYVAEKASSGSRGMFKGAAWEAESKEELDKAAKIPGASSIVKLEGPGGGLCVTIPDPWGIPFRVVWGQDLVEPQVPRDVTKPINQGTVDVESKPRPAGVFQRFPHSDVVPVHKLGHYVLNVPSYVKAKDFYLKHFNLTPSDIMTIGKGGRESGAFLHLDRGKEHVDHHSIYIQDGPPNDTEPTLHHSAYEVFDLDHEFRGHENLLRKGYTLAWGVGRHVLGSQLFDYWHQSGDGFNVEHYADGDLVNDTTPVGIHAISEGPPSEEHLSTWAPKFGETFFASQPADLIKKQLSVGSDSVSSVLPQPISLLPAEIAA
ncbi:Glyoxalase/Bleomycin resistance protein/Dihydroxybiphenyl dioxygenase [Meredithblackwellia eburnea MCA 4105]